MKNKNPYRISDTRIRFWVEIFVVLGRAIYWVLFQLFTFWKIPERIRHLRADIRKRKEIEKIPPYLRDLEQ
jgi:hypothetical protein